MRLIDPDAERNVLGALLVAPDRIADVLDLTPEHFGVPAHREAWALMRRRFDAGRLWADGTDLRVSAPDPVRALLADLELGAPSVAHLGAAAEALRELWVRRSLAAVGELAGLLAQDGTLDAGEAVAEVEARLLAARGGRVEAGPTAWVDVFAGALRAVQAAQNGEQPGLATGLAGLDSLLGGLHPGQLVVLAARPGLGKSAFSMQIATHVARAGLGVLVFNLEMHRTELGLRALCSEARVEQSALKARRLAPVHYYELERMAREAADLPLWIDDRAGQSITDLRAWARRHAARHPLSLVVVDYLQLVRGARQTARNRSRVEEVGEVSRGLKLLAKDLGVPVLALAQLSREVEKGNRRPQLSDLRESGSIEQDADAVVFLHRAADAVAGPESSAPVECEAVIAKQRNGRTGILPLVFFSAWVRFGERAWSHEERAPARRPSALPAHRGVE